MSANRKHGVSIPSRSNCAAGIWPRWPEWWRPTMAIEQGTPVEILIHAGAVERGRAGVATRFCGDVQAGQLGLYQGPMPGKLGKDGWHVIQFREAEHPLAEQSKEER